MKITQFFFKFGVRKELFNKVLTMVTLLDILGSEEK